MQVHLKIEVIKAKIFQCLKKTKSLALNHKFLAFLAPLFLFFVFIFVFHGGLSNPTGAIKNIVYSVGKQVKTDSQNHTNILLLGVGGGSHDGPDLTDTIIIASINHNDNSVAMVSIPRDFYLKTPLTGAMKINSVYESVKRQKESSVEALDYLKSQFSELFNVEIHYYAKVDFDGFRQIIDALGGITVNVEADIVDPYYPKEGTYLYETFIIRKGEQQLDGNTALKYVRSRKTTSDFDRSRRQQQVINAIKDKALSLNTLANPSKITALYESVAANYETDLTLREIIYLGSLAEDIKGNDKIVMNVLHDDPSRPGGVLYTPIREYYGGMYVLLPQNDDYSVVGKYIEMLLYNPLVFDQNTSLQILNGSKQVGLAAKLRQKLQFLGFRVPRYGNAKSLNVATTKLYIRNPEVNMKTAEYLANYLNAELTANIPSEYNEVPYKSSADLVLEIGENFVEPE